MWWMSCGMNKHRCNVYMEFMLYLVRVSSLLATWLRWQSHNSTWPSLLCIKTWGKHKFMNDAEKYRSLLDYCGAVINNNVCDIVVRLSLFYGEHLFWLLKYVLVSWVLSNTNSTMEGKNPISAITYHKPWTS